jgi:gliding motility-associated-like protein
LGNGTTSELNQPEANYDEPGSYTITLVASNQFGCTDTARAGFIQHPTPQAVFTAEPQPGCVGYPISFVNASVNASIFAWSLGDGNASTLTFPLHSYTEPGVYPVRLIAYGVGGCSDTLAVNDAVTIHPRPVAAYTTDTLESLPNALQFRNLSEGAMSFVWDFDDGETSTAIHPLHVFPADGGAFLVCLVGVNDFGCPDTTCKFINVPGDPNVFVPNAFTPNGDTRNDTFRPVLNGFVGWNYRLMIFDRWGLKAYETTDPGAGWDGTRNGTESPVDVYVWKLIVERDGDARNFVGHVTLVR